MTLTPQELSSLARFGVTEQNLQGEHMSTKALIAEAVAGAFNEMWGGGTFNGEPWSAEGNEVVTITEAVTAALAAVSDTTPSEGEREVLLVTIKLPKNPAHDPRDKKTAACSVSPACTDSTGEHHTLIVWSQAEIDQVRAVHHITRVETARLAPPAPVDRDECLRYGADGVTDQKCPSCEAKASTAQVVTRGFESTCAEGTCPGACTHLMWYCTACTSEGGWGAPRDLLEGIAASHRCPPPPVTTAESLEPVIIAAEVAWRGRGQSEPLASAIARDIAKHLQEAVSLI